MQRVKDALIADWGVPIERTARAAAVIVAVAYAAGLTLGEWVHAANDSLAELLVTLRKAPAVPAAELAPALSYEDASNQQDQDLGAAPDQGRSDRKFRAREGKGRERA